MTLREFIASPVWVLGTFNVLGLTGITIWAIMAHSIFVGVHVALVWFLFAFTVGHKYWKGYRASSS